MNLKVTGIDQAVKNLKTLEAKIVRKVVRSSVRKGAAPIVKASRSRAPSRTGVLSRSIKVTGVRIDKSKGTATAYVGSKGTKAQQAINRVFYSKVTRSGKSRRYGAAFYHHMVVSGTKPHTIPGPVKLGSNWYSDVQHPGARPNPFYEHAAVMAFKPSVAAFSKAFGPAVEAEARRLPK